MTVPMGFAAFKEQRDPPAREMVEDRYNIVHWAKMESGGHFAAWEEPTLFAEEVAGFFDRWR
jgi:pimeloyl-ACP methyl ester carboxylesterase